jgi:hypothetical protein
MRRGRRPRSVVGIDQHNAARNRFSVYVDEVGLPAVILVQRVGVQFDAKLCETAEYSG